MAAAATAETRTVDHATVVFDRLQRTYPDAGIQLDHRDAGELLVSVILSAQCTDVRVNLITPALFERYPDLRAFAAADVDELAEQIRTCGLFRNKARSIIGAAATIVDRHGGEVPRTREALMALPGIGRKSANVILSNAFGQDAFAVDTHVGRLARRLGFSDSPSPDRVERDVTALLPRERWSRAHHLLIWHGRRCCHARNPACERCPLADLCPSRR